MSEELLKHSLLLIHGTIYGYLVVESPPQNGYEGISSSFTNGWSVPWRQDQYFVQLAAPAPFGPMTDNSPIDVVHWNAGLGAGPPSALFPYQQCLTLLTRL